MAKIKEREQLQEPKISIKPEARVVDCQIVQEKLVSKLDDGREISIAIDLLTKWGVLDKEIKAEQLKNPEIHSEGRYIYFSEIDDTLPAWIISQGIFKSCWEK